MKRNLLKLLAIALLASTTGYASAQTFTYPVKGEKGFSLTEKTRGNVAISYNLGEFSFNNLNYKGEDMSEITISAITLPNNAGCPNLPTESRFIAIPQGATAKLNVVSFEKEVIQNVNIAPALRIQAESEEPDMNYVKDKKVYTANANYPENPFVISETTSLRGVDAVVVSITPFQYNPVTKELTVYSNIKLDLQFEGGNGEFGDSRLRSPYWDGILAAELMNYDQLPVIDYSARMQQWLRDGAEGAEYIIVTPNNDEWAPYANQLKEFRTKQGIITKVYRLDEMPANSTNEMKAWFHNAYNTWEIAPVSVCLLGDHGTNMTQYIPAETVSHPYSGSCITDNRYADPTGDNLPDMVFSRLVAKDASELPVFVGKQIEYEYTNVNMDPSFYTRPITALGWQTERWFQLCSEVFGGYMRNKGYDTNRINCIYQGNPGSIWSSAENTNNVVNYFGPNGTGYIPQAPNELGDWNNGSPEMVVNAVNEGTFWLQHRDHGLETGWGEPAMRNSHVAQCNNVNKLTFVMSINCLTGMFNYNSDCFAEAWMRRTYNGENAGAVGLLCPTETSYSFVNDAYVWGVYDLFDSDFMPTYGPYADKSDNWMPAFGNVAGKYFLHQSSWPYNDYDKDITYTMFTAHCDAFLRIYTQVPEQMDIIHPEVVLAGLTEISVTAPHGCTVSLVKENAEGEWEILAVAEGTGEMMTMEFPSQVPPTQIHIVATGQNYLRYEAVMDVIPADGPYIVFDSKVIHDENGNGQLDFGELVRLDITVKNVGSEAADLVSSCMCLSQSPYLQMLQVYGIVGCINPNETHTIENACVFNVSDSVPDNTSNLFTVDIELLDENYVSNFSMKAYAPILKIKNMSITEIEGNGNGRLDAGETAQLNFTFENKGHADAALTTAMLNMLSPYITFEENEIEFETVAADETMTATYNITVSEDTPMGYSCPFSFNVNSGYYSDSKDFSVKVGLIIEDFETGDFSEGWTNDAQKPWRIVSEEPYEGEYCVRSGSISNNGTTTLILQHEAGSDDEISFYYKVSSEANYDKMHFYIDGIEKGTWSGTVSWTQTSYPVSAGRHTYKWTYTKDTSVSNGSDCCWIDYISLPAARIMAGTAGPDVNVCEGNDAQIIGYAIHHDNLTWTTAGDGTFNDPTIATPLYTPGTQDIEARSVVLTLTINGQGETITDDMTVNITENVTLEVPDGGSLCNNGQPQEVSVSIEGDYESLTWKTFGDGEFENPNEVLTYYTLGAQDIANGYVQMEVDVKTYGCGLVKEGINYMVAVPPQLTLQENSIDICEGEHAYMDAILSGSNIMHGGFEIFAEDTTLYVNDPGYNTIPLGVLPVGETVFNFTGVVSPFCYTGYAPGELTFTVNVHPLPTLQVSNTEQTICEGETASFDMTLTGDAPFSISAEGMDDFTADANQFTLNLNPDEDFNASITKVTDANGCETPLDIALTVNIHALPTLQIANTEQTICEGETASFDMTLTGDAPFNISAEGMDDFTADANEFTINLNPNESFNATISKVTDANGCETSLDIALTVNVLEGIPLTITGDQNPDAYYTPTSTYTIEEDNLTIWTIDPTDAGSMVSSNDGKSVSITWTDGFKGNVALTAIPDIGCETGTTINILVKNSTSVNENTIEAAIFPNPTNDNVTIKADNMQRIIIANALGQIVYNAEFKGNETILNMSQFGVGMFTIRIITANGIGTRQVTVVR